MVSKAMEKRLSKISAYAEATGYVANIAINLHKIRVMQLQELVLLSRLVQHRKVRTGGFGCVCARACGCTCVYACVSPCVWARGEGDGGCLCGMGAEEVMSTRIAWQACV